MAKEKSADQGIHETAPLSGWFWLSAVLLIILKLWLARGMTFNGIGYMAADDQLFINQAGSILNGDWLGSYTFLTLFKGPFYPLFIAITFLTGIPLLSMQQGLYALACLSVCLAVVPLFRRPNLLLILLAILLFNPMSVTNTVSTRVLREGIYPAITLLSLAAAIALVLRLEKPFRQRIAWLLLFGISLGAFWLTREERIWILPSMLILTGLAVYRILAQRCCGWRPALINLILPGLMLGAAVLTVCGLNLRHYGIFAITEYDSPVFLKAYGSLTRVKPETWQPLIPVAAETRERIYAVSPSFSRLEPYLEGDIGLLYSRYGENVKSDRHEMGGGWFHMALRESVERAVINNGKFPAAYYRQLAEEIDAACDTGKLECGPPRSSFMAVWNNTYLTPLLVNTWTALKYMVSFDGYDGGLKDCLGTDYQLRPFIDLTRERCWHTNLSVLVQGWVVKPDEAISLWVYDNAGNKVVSPTVRSDEGDLIQLFMAHDPGGPEGATAPFQMEADCPNECALVVKGEDGRVIEEISLVDPDSYLDAPDANGLYYHFYSIDWRAGDEVDNPIIFKLNTIKSRVLSIPALAHQKAVPAVAALSLIVFLFQTIVVPWKRRDLTMWGIELALLAGIATRLIMVAWLETSSIDAIITTYLSPIYPFLLVFLALPWYWLVLNWPVSNPLKASASVSKNRPRPGR